MNLIEQAALASENYEWFKENLHELEKLYGDKYVVIKGKRVIGDYPSWEAALNDMKGKEAIGTFIIQLCTSDESKTTATIVTPFFLMGGD